MIRPATPTPGRFPTHSGASIPKYGKLKKDMLSARQQKFWKIVALLAGLALVLSAVALPLLYAF